MGRIGGAPKEAKNIVIFQTAEKQMLKEFSLGESVGKRGLPRPPLGELPKERSGNEWDPLIDLEVNRERSTDNRPALYLKKAVLGEQPSK